ncbi:MAG: hypothetical protein IT186_23470 [Acidobacteria bacterium]|nr:hypothetical protein [Acidobacteriota bacterium]
MGGPPAMAATIVAAKNTARAGCRALVPETFRERASLAAMAFSGILFLSLETWGLEAFYRLASRILPELPGFRLEIFAANLLPAFFAGLAVLMTFGSLTTAVSLLFLSDEIPFLIPLPVRPGTIFRRQLGLSIAYSSSPALFLLAPLAGLLAIHSEHALLALAAFLASLFSVIILCGLAGALLSLGLVRLIPPDRARLVAGTFSALSLGAALVGARQTRPERLFDPVAAVELLQGLASEPPSTSSRNPLQLLALACARALTGDPGSLYPALGALGFALFLFLAAARGFAGVHLAAFRKSREEGTRRITSATEPRAARTLTRELFDAEVRNLARDAGTPAQIGSLLAVLILNVLNMRLLPVSDAAGKDLVFGLQTGLTLFLVSALCLRFTFPSVSTEGRTALLLRTFPVDPLRALAVRLAVHSGVAVFLAATLTLTSGFLLEVPAPALALSSYFVLLGGLTIPAIQLGMGALYPRFDAPNAIAAALGPGGFVAIGISMLLAIPTTALASREVLSLLESLIRRPLPHMTLSLLWGGGAILAAWTSLRLGLQARRTADLSLP